jgi:sterol desaturase/sphingolipid hydroxylase (fatty acid hydroxylase superfamily)
MTEFILAHEAGIRLTFFCAVLAIMIGWEFAAPRRRLSAPVAVRWCSNLGLVIVSALLVRLAFPLVAVGTAAIAAERGWGLFNWVPAPSWLAIAVSVVALDLAIYAQHVVFHKVPALWRLHRMHHSDVDIDATTGVRFHPVEIALSMAIKMAMILILGAPAVAVVIFEVLLNATAMFNHGNVELPQTVDRALRLVVVTPDFHRVHHSVYRDETDSNYGFNLSVWDRLFRTYRPQPRDGHKTMTIGLDVFRDPRQRHLDKLLIQPFVEDRRRDAVTSE